MLLRLWRLCAALLVAALALVSTTTAQSADEADKLIVEVERLDKEGKYAEAIPIAERVLAVDENVLGPQHPDVATDLNNLAGLYRAQGRYVEAEPLYKRALAIREKVLGPDHLDVAQSLNNLAGLYQAQGRYAEVEPLYKRALEIREKLLGPQHADVGTSLNNLAVLYEAQGHYDEAEPLYKRALVIDEKALGPLHPHIAADLANLAGLVQAQGRYAEAEPLYKRALVIDEKASGLQHPDVASDFNSLAHLYQAQGRYVEAEPLYKRALAIGETALGPEHPRVAEALNNLAGLYGAQGRYAEAEPLHKRSLAIAEKTLGLQHPDVARSLNNLAWLYQAQGRYVEAEPLYKRAQAITEAALGSEHAHLANSLSNLGRLYVALGRNAEANSLYWRSLTIREKALGPEHPDVAQSLDNLAGLALARNDFASAAESWRRATAILKHRAAHERGDRWAESSNGEARRNSWYFSGLVKVAWRLDPNPDAVDIRAAETFETAQWVLNSEAAASLAQMAVRSAGGSSALAALMRERQDLVGEWQRGDKSLINARSQESMTRHADAEKALSEQLAKIDTRLAEIDAVLANEFPGYAALASPNPMALADVQAGLRDDEALVLFLDTDDLFKPLPEETFTWVVTKTGVRWARSDLGTEALQEHVAALRCGLDAAARDATDCAGLLSIPASQGPTANDPLPFDHARAHALYKGLFGDVEDLIKDKHLLIVPSGALAKLPFQVLVTSPPKTSNDKHISWLIRDHAISVLPAVSSLKALRGTAMPSAATRPLIGFGNPLLDGDQDHPRYGDYFKQVAAEARAVSGCAETRKQRTAMLRAVRRSIKPLALARGVADMSQIRLQAPLPETADELCAVARHLGANVDQIRIGARATETEVKSLSASGALAKYRIVHFATHGTLAGQLSGTTEPGLILTPPAEPTADDDGYLAASDIVGLKLDADWVILSACNTAGGGKESGEGNEALSGLARAFFYAGARSLLVSHWAVDSDATVKLITGAVGATARDPRIGRAEALRRAMLALIDAGEPREALPEYWAPFVLVGEGSLQATH